MSNTKYIFVTGGVTSSLGKGIIAASLAKLLQAQDFKVTIQKFDPYINVDPGTLNPYEHGECFVTDDGAETDLDLGHYERFLNVTTSQANNVTTGAQAVDNEGYAFGITYFSGSNEVDLAYYGTKNENTGITDNENDEIVLAYRNNLSKRTTLYAKLCNSDRGANAPAGACIGSQGENDTYYGFGVFHKF